MKFEVIAELICRLLGCDALFGRQADFDDGRIRFLGYTGTYPSSYTPTHSRRP
jgi:hypothetical protein